MTDPVLFLDVDGVLNDHTKRRNGHSGMVLEKILLLDSVIVQVPNLKLVISSDWRHFVHNKEMTLRGFETMLVSHGLDAYRRIMGVTAPDNDRVIVQLMADWPETAFLRLRAKQILDFVAQHRFQRWAVLDDLPLPLPQLVQVDGRIGLTARNVADVVAKLISRL